jgi:hypothetical protein
VTLRHAQAQIADRFESDLEASVEEVRAVPAAEDAGGLAPIYGLAASVPDRTLVSDFLKAYMDRWYVP